MRKNLVLLLIFAFGVEMYLTQDEYYITEPATTEGIAPPNPMSNLEPFSFEDFKNPIPPVDPKICHIPNMKCYDSSESSAPVCAFARNYGLINFVNICEIKVQNCLVQPLGTDPVYGVPTPHDDIILRSLSELKTYNTWEYHKPWDRRQDIIYHNGKKHDCFFYFNKSKNHEDAIRLYYKLGYETDEVENNLEDFDDDS